MKELSELISMDINILLGHWTLLVVINLVYVSWIWITVDSVMEKTPSECLMLPIIMKRQDCITRKIYYLKIILLVQLVYFMYYSHWFIYQYYHGCPCTHVFQFMMPVHEQSHLISTVFFRWVFIEGVVHLFCFRLAYEVRRDLKKTFRSYRKGTRCKSCDRKCPLMTVRL